MFLKVGFLVLSIAVIAQGAPRIIGGHDAPNHKYPYQISFRGRGIGHFCSGSILNERWILSAAHCFEKREINSFKIYAGTNFLNESGTVYEPQFYIVHERYRNFYHFDIALVRLKRNIVFTDFVKPIELPTEDLQDYSRPAYFAGWGSTKLSGPSPNALQEIYLNLLNIEQCQKSQPYAIEHHICTYNKYGEGICHGDSGGPLVVDGVQVGIASYVRPCAIDYPDIYTRVFSYKAWIDRNLERYANVWE